MASGESAVSAVSLSEDVPLKGSKSSGWGGWGGPRGVAVCFGVLSVGIALALAGSSRAPPQHGAVSSRAAACSAAGAALLRAGGTALGAAAVAALCLAAADPNPAALDASGAMLAWDYRREHDSPPQLIQWGGDVNETLDESPRLVCSLAQILSESRDVSSAWEAALRAAEATVTAGADSPRALYLRNARVAGAAAAATRCGPVRREAAAAGRAPGWTVWAAPAVAEGAAAGLRVGLPAAGAAASPAAVDDAVRMAAAALPPAPDIDYNASGLAVIDDEGYYVALVTGVPGGASSAAQADGGWARAPPGPLDLAPAILTQDAVCGVRMVAGGESRGALWLAVAALAAAGDPEAVERVPPGTRAVNVVSQRADQLASHADSRGGGLASRF